MKKRKLKKVVIDVPIEFEKEIMREINKYLSRFTFESENEMFELSEIGLKLKTDLPDNEKKILWERWKFLSDKYSYSF